jgi:hypothetical protein
VDASPLSTEAPGGASAASADGEAGSP